MNKWMLCATMVAAMLCFVSCKEEADSGIENGHEWVDLGLKVKWATCNVGATTPEGYGDYFAWGETTTKNNYSYTNSLTDGDESIGDIKGNAKYDAATAHWGGDWRMPTKKEMLDLIDNCTCEWTTINGVGGCRFTSKRNGNSIFLPAAGCFSYEETPIGGWEGDYWTSTPYDNPTSAYQLYCNAAEGGFVYWCADSRRMGCSIRPVLK